MREAKQPNARYRRKGRTLYTGVDCWVNDADAKRIAKEARARGVKAMAQFDRTQGATYIYVPDASYAHDTGVVYGIEQELGIA